jgi:hypothetical protein
MFLQLTPGDICPFLTQTCVWCLGFFHATCTPSFRITVSTSAYPEHYSRRLLLRLSHQTDTCGWYLLILSILHESYLLVTSFQLSVLRYCRLLLSAGFGGGEYQSALNLLAPILVHFGPSPALTVVAALFRVGLFPITTVHMQIHSR